MGTYENIILVEDSEVSNNLTLVEDSDVRINLSAPFKKSHPLPSLTSSYNPLLQIRVKLCYCIKSVLKRNAELG
jgi:hypothetical protein